MSLNDGWNGLVQITGTGMPGPDPMRRRASRTEADAVFDSMQALVSGSPGLVDPYRSRQPPAPFLTVTWMTRLDNSLASGPYIQPGLTVPGPLSRTLASRGLDRPCGLSATAVE